MTKLKLKLDQLEVCSFTAQDEHQGRGTVNGMGTHPYNTCRPSFYETECLCTDAEGCYPSLYCSQGVGPGEPNGTCYAGCMTNAKGAC